jgi:hypothetical protein
MIQLVAGFPKIGAVRDQQIVSLPVVIEVQIPLGDSTLMAWSTSSCRLRVTGHADVGDDRILHRLRTGRCRLLGRKRDKVEPEPQMFRCGLGTFCSDKRPA